MSLMHASLVWAALLASAPVEPEAAYREAARVLGQQQRYAFCAADTSYTGSPTDRAWCELAAKSDYRGCPGYARVCGRDRPESEASLAPGGASAGGSAGEDFNPNAREGAEQAEPEKMPKLGGLARVLVWLLIGLLLIAAVVALRRLALGRRELPEVPDELPDELDASASLSVAQLAARAIETDVERLLARAEQAEQRGDFEQAIAEVYAALVRRLEGEALIHVDRWKTNGDYLRELARREDGGALRDEVRAIIRSVEQVQFGAAPAEPTRYRDIRAKVIALVRRASLALLLALSLSGQLACDQLETETRTQAEQDRDAAARRLAGLGARPSEYRAAAELLLAFDIEARHRLRTIDELSASEGAIVVLDVNLSETHWQRLLEWVHDEGGTLVLATGRTLPEATKLHYTKLDPHERTQLVPPPDAAAFSPTSERELSVCAPPGRGFVETKRTLGGHEALLSRPALRELARRNPAYAGELHYVARRYHGKGKIVAFADSSLWRNAGLLVDDNAAFLVNLLRRENIDTVEFVDGRTGTGPDSPLESVREAKLTPLFVQILVLLALLYAAAGLPFTRLRDPAERRRRAFSEHVRTLGERYAQAKAAQHVASSYSTWALDHLRARLVPGGAAGLHPLAQALAIRTGRSEGELMALLVEAQELREGEGSGSSTDQLARMHELSLLVDACARMSSSAQPAEPPLSTPPPPEPSESP